MEHFSSGRSFNHIKYFAILNIVPSASKEDISRAYKSLAKKYHPDKTGNADGSLFRRVKEASDFLLDNINFDVRKNEELPFDPLIRSVGTLLREKANAYINQQSYELLAKLVRKLGDLKNINTLVKPRLDHCEIIDETKSLIRGSIEKVRVDVDSNWSERKYQALNENITDLKMMENELKSYPEIFSKSWNDGIVKKVKNEIEDLGKRAHACLRSQNTAKSNLDKFRRCFIDMGCVLVELPLFKDFTKGIMCDVLESCLSSDWGYSFLFEFGLGLQRSDENMTEEENHVAQIIVSEFSHFKEVMTMVWNEETPQKPADDTVLAIQGYHRNGLVMDSLEIDRSRLLESFKVFESQYKKLLGEYISPDTDLKSLAKKTIDSTHKLGSLNCNSGWTDDLKREIPHILASVFTVFTVLKSGDSYN
jgi:hypothetical protein